MASPIIIGTVLMIMFFIMLFINIPIAVSLGASALVTSFMFNLSPDVYADIMYTGLSKFPLLAVPFFILSGIVMEQTGISKKIIDFANLFVGPIPGGLAIMSVIVTLFWGAISGSGPATVAALGIILIPAMIEAGYDKGFAASIIAATGAVSIVIPPSGLFILYGTLTGVSIGALFAAGVIPGLIMGGCFLVYVVWYSVKKGYVGKGRFGTPKEIWAGFKDAFWGLMTPVIILGGIYGGIFTPTEAAIISVWYALFVGIFIYKSFKFRDFIKMLSSSGVTSASVLIILANASVFAWLMTSFGVATAFSNIILSASGNHMIVLLLMLLILIIAGFFLDANSILYITIPLFLPIIKKFGLDSIWLGVMMSMACAVGFTTPPVAVNLYPAAQIAGINLSTISKGIIGFVIAGIVGTVVVVMFPDVVMWLPRVTGMIK